MKNVVITIFNEESRIYEALSQLKQNNGSLGIIASGIIKNNKGALAIKDGFDLSDYDDNWASAGLIGGMLGILGGPVGILLGSGLGMTIGSGFDLEELEDNDSVLKQVASELEVNKLALITLVEETDTERLDELLFKYGAQKIIRKSYLAVQEELLENEALEKHLAKEARTQKRQEKKAKWHDAAVAKEEEFVAKIKKMKQGKTS